MHLAGRVSRAHKGKEECPGEKQWTEGDFGEYCMGVEGTVQDMWEPGRLAGGRKGGTLWEIWEPNILTSVSRGRAVI